MKNESLEDLMYRARANKTMVRAVPAYVHREIELRAFIDLFHPNMTETEIKEMIRQD